jgi:hypothetical protein
MLYFWVSYIKISKIILEKLKKKEFDEKIYDESIKEKNKIYSDYIENYFFKCNNSEKTKEITNNTNFAITKLNFEDKNFKLPDEKIIRVKLTNTTTNANRRISKRTKSEKKDYMYSIPITPKKSFKSFITNDANTLSYEYYNQN